MNGEKRKACEALPGRVLEGSLEKASPQLDCASANNTDRRHFIQEVTLYHYPLCRSSEGDLCLKTPSSKIVCQNSKILKNYYLGSMSTSR